MSSRGDGRRRKKSVHHLTLDTIREIRKRLENLGPFFLLAAFCLSHLDLQAAAFHDVEFAETSQLEGHPELIELVAVLEFEVDGPVIGLLVHGEPALAIRYLLLFVVILTCAKRAEHSDV